MTELVIVHSGSYSSLQDGGRWGYGGWGVPRSGTCFPKFMKMANHLVGNPTDCVGIEFFMKGPILQAHGGDIRLAISSDCKVSLSGDQRMRGFQSFHLKEGDSVDIGASSRFKGGFIAIEGGVDLDPVLGSHATYARSAIGGLQGANLKSGDRLPLNAASSLGVNYRLDPEAGPSGQKIRVICGPQDDYFEAKSLETFFSTPFQISPENDRMGVRLSGPKLNHRADKGTQIISDAACVGAIQVPGNGAPIVLLNDAQSVGGYPKIGCVLSIDIEELAQKLPGQTVEFEEISPSDALLRVREDHERFEALLAAKRPVFDKDKLDPTLLYEHNLISGVVYETHKEGT